jgi:DNA-binding MarR family transcriptional regulator
VLRHDIIRAKDATVTGLARFYRVQPSVLTRALTSMDTDGLITRTVDRDDSRIIRVAITELGLEVSRYVEQMYIAEVLEAIRSLPDDEVAPLHRTVDQLDVIADELDQRRFDRSRRAEQAIEDIAPPE